MIHELKLTEALDSFLNGKAVLVATKENRYAFSPLEIFLKDCTFIIDDEIKVVDPALSEKHLTKKECIQPVIEEKEPAEENPEQELQKVEIPEAAKKKVKGYYGFLHIRCNKCGNTHSFCSKGRINQHKCPECGKQTELSQLKRAYINCECGGIFRYFTNESEEMFDLTCLKCGQPVALNYNRKKNLYATIKDIE